MITKQNLKEVLEKLGFSTPPHNERKFIKTYQDDAFIEVDFDAEKIKYPSNLKINDETTTNFSHNENFVVLECVNRLLEKGYKPHLIELEPKWKLGRSAKSGKADILVRDFENRAYLIIECKTAESEFDSEWQNMQNDGGQLISYAYQEQNAKFLCLYASDFDVEISYQNKVINIANIFREFSPKSSEELANSWIKSGAIFEESGIFEGKIEPYFIGTQKKNVSNLNDVGSDIDKKYHEFATILRKHNISSKENAFDKLVNLFLCKIVDEIKNSDDLKFSYKGSLADSYFDMQDRLERLYHDGMREFLNENVTYVDDESINSSFTNYSDNALKQTIKNYFLQLKFYSNNNFAFLEVYNEELFKKNAEILREIIALFENLKLRSSKPNQFLGNLFELFLDGGFKQSEGQFFTPLPIVKFIVSSLPLANLVQNDKDLKVIDYACGAGHFLIEYANEIKNYIKDDDLKNYYAKIYGIEKEYRLSKVSKVSTFMYGQEDVKIIYGDGLMRKEDVKEGSFSLLIANPPYSVKGFLQTLSDDERQKFELNNVISDEVTSNNIECFFVERAYKLLKPGGIAAIILPSSFLNKSTPKIYEATREIILKYFEIFAISEFSNKAFGETGTNTVTIFIKKRFEPPRYADILKDREQNDFLNNSFYKDENLISEYAKFQGYDENLFREFLNGEKNEIFENENFRDYETLCKSQNEYKKLLENFKKASFKDDYFKKSKQYEDLICDEKFKNLSKREQNLALKNALDSFEIDETEKKNLENSMICEFAKQIELEKIYYFSLVNSQSNSVVIVKSPSDNKEQKEFLGYEWSKSKGREGAKPLNSKISDDEILDLKGWDKIQTPLYNPVNMDDESKINHLIRQNFLGEIDEIPIDLQKFVSVSSLKNMIDFKKSQFDKAINLSAKNSVEIVSKFELVRLGEIVQTIETGSRPSGGVGTLKEGVFSLGGEHIHNTNGTINLSNPKFVSRQYYKNSQKGKLVKNDILLCKDGALTGKVAFLNDELDGKDAMVNEHVFILRADDLITQKYIFYFLYSSIGQSILKQNITGAAQGGLNSTNLKNIKIPFDKKAIKKIVAECQKVDDEFKIIRMEIDEFKAKMSQIFTKFGIEFKQNGGGTS